MPMPHVQLVKARLLASPASTPLAFFWAAAAAMTPTLIRASLDGLVADTTFPTYFPFVLLAAIFLGWRPAMFTAALSALAANYLFMGPPHELFATVQDTAGTLVFLTSAIAIIFATETVRSAHLAANLDRRLLGLARSAAGPMPRS
ncbi:DUF4118 domain-containing protein [Phenylobacterium sp.]|uniref:DUF4118 domain-containing protein n=1 Tax=Phenylobacterium sp. TaxID=1871053 RepID=UPI002F427DA1